MEGWASSPIPKSFVEQRSASDSDLSYTEMETDEGAYPDARVMNPAGNGQHWNCRSDHSSAHRKEEFTRISEWDDMLHRIFQLMTELQFPWKYQGGDQQLMQGVVEHVKPDVKSPVKVATGQGFIRTKPQDVLQMVLNAERRPEWDDLCDFGSIVKQFGDNSDIIYLSYQGKLGVCARDLCLLRAWKEMDDGSFVLVSHSIDCDDVPKVAGKVRAECRDCGYIMTPAGDGCVLTYVIQLDMKGYVPLFFSNLIQTQHPLIISMLRRHLENGGSTDNFTRYAHRDRDMDMVN